MAVTQEALEKLASEVGALLVARGWLLVTAESCTGGWVAQAVTAIAGSSTWFDRGFVTYSNASKEELLGVLDSTLETQGAVSEATVREMAYGALASSRAQVAVAVSGIAGPGGGSPEKPVGTVWLAWALPDRMDVECCCFDGERSAVRSLAVAATLAGLCARLKA